MLDFIVTYWLEFLFGLIAAAVTFLIKQYYNLQKKVHNQQRDNFEEEIIEAINSSLKKEQEKTNKEIAEELGYSVSKVKRIKVRINKN